MENKFYICAAFRINFRICIERFAKRTRSFSATGFFMKKRPISYFTKLGVCVFNCLPKVCGNKYTTLQIKPLLQVEKLKLRRSHQLPYEKRLQIKVLQKSSHTPILCSGAVLAEVQSPRCQLPLQMPTLVRNKLDSPNDRCLLLPFEN